MLRMNPTNLAPSCPESVRPRTASEWPLGARPPSRGRAGRARPQREGQCRLLRGVLLHFIMVYCAAPLLRLFHCFCNWGIVGGLASLRLRLLSRFSRVRLCATPQTAAYQAPPSLGFSRQEHRSGLPFPSPVHESEK